MEQIAMSAEQLVPARTDASPALSHAAALGVLRCLEAESFAAQISGTVALARALLAAIPDALLIVHGQGRVVEANPALEKMFGYCREELLGQPVQLLGSHRVQ